MSDAWHFAFWFKACRRTAPVRRLIEQLWGRWRGGWLDACASSEPIAYIDTCTERDAQSGANPSSNTDAHANSGTHSHSHTDAHSWPHA